LQALPAGDNNAATLEDQRDTAIADLAQLMDIRVVTDNANVATVYTTSGLQLVGVQASQLSFNSQGTLNASSLWNSNPALSTAGTAVTSGSQAGFDLDLSNVLPGNTIHLTYTDTATNTPHQITIVRVDDPTALPLPNTAASPNDKVIGVNFQGGMASIVAQIT